MALTVAIAQALLARRLGEYAGLVDLVDLLAVGHRSAGLAQDSLSALTDADLARAAAGDVDQVLDVAEAAGIDRILANLDPLRLRALGIDEDPASIERRLRTLADRLRARVERTYGVGLQALSGGVLTFDFAQRGDETFGGEF